MSRIPEKLDIIDALKNALHPDNLKKVVEEQAKERWGRCASCDLHKKLQFYKDFYYCDDCILYIS